MMGVFGERIFEILIIVIRKNTIKTNPTTMNEYKRTCTLSGFSATSWCCGGGERERKAQKCIDIVYYILRVTKSEACVRRGARE